MVINRQTIGALLTIDLAVVFAALPVLAAHGATRLALDALLGKEDQTMAEALRVYERPATTDGTAHDAA